LLKSACGLRQQLVAVERDESSPSISGRALTPVSVSILDRGKLGWAGIKRGVNCAGALHHDSGLLSLHGVAASIGAMRPTPAELEVARALIARVNEVRIK